MTTFRLLFFQFTGTAIFVLLASLPAFAGGDTSGGGTLIVRKPGDKPVLLDLALRDPGFSDTYEFKKSIGMPDTEFLKVVGFDRADFRGDPAFVLATKRLNAWRHESPIVVGLIRNALAQMPLLYTSHRLKVLPEFDLPAEKAKTWPDAGLVSAAIYDGIFGSRISRAVWDDLGDMSKAGLLIHEALRHIQLASPGDARKLTNIAIQEITGRIMLSNPKKGENFDSEHHLNSQLLKQSREFGEREKRHEEIENRTSQLLKTADNALSRLRGTGLKNSRNSDCAGCVSANTGNFDVLYALLRDTQKELSDYRFANWEKLTQKERDLLESLSFGALNLASDANAASVISKVDGANIALARISDAIRNAMTPEMRSLRFRVEQGQANIRRYIQGDTRGMTTREKIGVQRVIEELCQHNKKLMESGVLVGPED